MTVEGDQALVSFALKVPGEEVAREVVEVLVPRSALEKALGTSLLGARMPGSNSVGGEG